MESVVGTTTGDDVPPNFSAAVVVRRDQRSEVHKLLHHLELVSDELAGFVDNRAPHVKARPPHNSSAMLIKRPEIPSPCLSPLRDSNGSDAVPEACTLHRAPSIVDLTILISFPEKPFSYMILHSSSRSIESTRLGKHFVGRVEDSDGSIVLTIQLVTFFVDRAYYSLFLLLR